MQNSVLLYPMTALFLLNMTIMAMLLYFRVKAVRMRKVSPRYFKLNKGRELPEHLEALSQNYNNLLELPLLFYIICLVAIVLNLNVESFVNYAWLYVILRYIHSAIHTTYNHILHRLFIFATSCAVLITMWVKVLLATS